MGCPGSQIQSSRHSPWQLAPPLPGALGVHSCSMSRHSLGAGGGVAEGSGENRGSDQGILETPLPVPCSPRESDVTINKAFKQLMSAPKWLTLANTAEGAGSPAMCCSKLSPEKALDKYTTSPERSPSCQSQGCSRAGHQAYVTSTVLLIGQK